MTKDKFASKKYSVALIITIIWAITVLRAVFVGFPKTQAGQAWTFLMTVFTPMIMVFWGWYFKIDIDEKKLLK